MSRTSIVRTRLPRLHPLLPFFGRVEAPRLEGGVMSGSGPISPIFGLTRPSGAPGALPRACADLLGDARGRAPGSIPRFAPLCHLTPRDHPYVSLQFPDVSRVFPNCVFSVFAGVAGLQSCSLRIPATPGAFAFACRYLRNLIFGSPLLQRAPQIRLIPRKPRGGAGLTPSFRFRLRSLARPR